ncbi:MAG: hypothetical protein ACREYF_14895 [Gammaproteobacteria bacterium]
MSTLILGYPLDIHIHAVHWALNKVSLRNQIVYTSDFPQVLRSSIRFSGKKPPQAEFRDQGARSATGEFETIWFRRAGHSMRPTNMVDADWTITERECEHHFRSLRYHLAPSALWVNDIDAREKARLKAMQLEVAKEAGLPIPETLFSNDPDEIRKFFAEFRASGVIFKLSDQANWHTPSQRERSSLFTTQLHEEHMKDDVALSNCPAIYQNKIAKKFELRVTCMDEVCFAARLDSQSKQKTKIDWRADFTRPLTPQVFELPGHIEERCIAFMKRLGLVFGCIDLIVTPNDEFVFLEVNEMGQFLWVEMRQPAFPLLRAFTTLLVQKNLTRASRLVGSDAISYQAFQDSGAWEQGHLNDVEHMSYNPYAYGVEV